MLLALYEAASEPTRDVQCKYKNSDRKAPPFLSIRAAIAMHAVPVLFGRVPNLLLTLYKI
jgi:hypothetical protein